MSFKNVRSDNGLKKSIQDELRKANGLPKGTGRVTSVRYNADTGEAEGTVWVPFGIEVGRFDPDVPTRPNMGNRLVLRGGKRAGVPYATTVKMTWNVSPIFLDTGHGLVRITAEVVNIVHDLMQKSNKT